MTEGIVFVAGSLSKILGSVESTETLLLSPQLLSLLLTFVSLVADSGGELGVSSLSSDATAASAQLSFSKMRLNVSRHQA